MVMSPGPKKLGRVFVQIDLVNHCNNLTVAIMATRSTDVMWAL